MKETTPRWIVHAQVDAILFPFLFPALRDSSFFSLVLEGRFVLLNGLWGVIDRYQVG